MTSEHCGCTTFRVVADDDAQSGLQDSLDLDPGENVRARSPSSWSANTARSAWTCPRNIRQMSGSVTMTKAHGCDTPTLGAACAARSIRSSMSGAIGSPVNSARVSRRRKIISYRGLWFVTTRSCQPTTRQHWSSPPCQPRGRLPRRGKHAGDEADGGRLQIEDRRSTPSSRR